MYSRSTLSRLYLKPEVGSEKPFHDFRGNVFYWSVNQILILNLYSVRRDENSSFDLVPRAVYIRLEFSSFRCVGGLNSVNWEISIFMYIT